MSPAKQLLLISEISSKYLNLEHQWDITKGNKYSRFEFIDEAAKCKLKNK